MIVCAVNSSVGGFAEFENVFLTGWLRAAVVVNDAAVAIYFDCVEVDFDGGVEFGAAIQVRAGPDVLVELLLDCLESSEVKTGVPFSMVQSTCSSSSFSQESEV